MLNPESPPDRPYVGLRLVPLRDTYVKPHNRCKVPRPLHVATVGAIKVRDEDVLTGTLLALEWGDVEKVSIAVMDYDRVSGMDTFDCNVFFARS